MKEQELKDFLEEQTEKFNHTGFIQDDPISIPHQFSKKEDIEIIGFIVATIAWGNRRSIINNGKKLVDIMGNQPLKYVLNVSDKELADLEFVHRTFNKDDLAWFIRFMRNTYSKGLSLESHFSHGNNVKERIINFRNTFIEIPHLPRSEKHISNPEKNSAAKRINMFLRWMVRNDKKGVDFGLWNSINTSELMIPLDVHTGNIARKLGMIKRNPNDWKALEELMAKLRKFDPVDPCKYDFALFGIGVHRIL